VLRALDDLRVALDERSVERFAHRATGSGA
jgi:hypothetical protein